MMIIVLSTLLIPSVSYNKDSIYNVIYCNNHLVREKTLVCVWQELMLVFLVLRLCVSVCVCVYTCVLMI